MHHTSATSYTSEPQCEDVNEALSLRFPTIPFRIHVARSLHIRFGFTTLSL